MSKPQAVDPDSSLRAWIAYDLRRLREQRGSSQTDLAKILSCTRQAVYNYEAGDRTPDLKQLRALDDAWDTGGHFARIWTYAERGHDPDWFKQYMGYEARARAIRSYEALWIPGLLQTPDYARVSLSLGAVRDVEAAVVARMARQSILDRADAPTMWVIIDGGVLDRPVGGPDVMRAQLAHLLEVTQRPKITLRVIPRDLGAHIGLDGSFQIITTHGVDRVYADANGGGRLIEAGPEVQMFKDQFDLLGSDALDRRSSRRLITHTMETMQ